MKRLKRLLAMLLVLTMLIGMAPAVFAAGVSFADVARDAWYYEPVQWAVSEGITGGTGPDSFSPDAACTRGQVVMFLWAAAGKPEPKSSVNTFTDVYESDYFCKAVLWAVEQGITGGIGNGQFGPDQPCTRGQVVTFLYAAAGKPESAAYDGGFADVNASDWYSTAVQWAVENGITGGVGDGRFGPDQTCTRGQIVTFLWKADQVSGGEAPEVTPEVTPDVTPEPTDEVVHSAEDAIALLENQAERYGYENALSELTEKHTTTIAGESYYRLQQNYQGIPVYGRTVVCAADENGEVVSVTGNPADVDEDVDLTPSVTLEQVEAAVQTYAESVKQLKGAVAVLFMSENELVVYVTEDGTAALAYELTVFVDDEPYEVVVDADSGAVYEMHSLVRTENIERTYTFDGSEKAVNVNFWHEDGIYYMDDHERNIQFYSAGGDTLTRFAVFFDENGRPIYYFFAGSDNWYNSEYELIEEPKAINYDEVQFGFSANKEILGVVETTKKEEKLTPKLQEAMQNVAAADTMFEDKFERNGWANDREKYLSVVYDCGNESYECDAYGLTMLSLQTGASLDETAHEFAHAVEQSESSMEYEGESGAIMEGLSDIFGELAEWYWLGDCNWLMGDGVRNIITPEQTKKQGEDDPHPTKYKGEYWYDGNDTSAYVHINSTVISHAAYLMSTDGGGALTMEQLGDLWYRAMLMMPSDCDFAVCRKLVELAAVNMKFELAQMECISRAFDEVGIYPHAEKPGYDVYYLHRDGTLSLYGIDGKLCGNYTIEMELDSDFESLFAAGNTAAWYIWQSVEGAARVQLGAKWGLYRCRVIDSGNTAKTHEFYVYVTYDPKDMNVEVHTDFGGAKVTGNVQKKEIVNDVQFLLPIEGAAVSVYERDSGDFVDSAAVEDINKGFNLVLSYGDYTLEASADGFVTGKTDFTVGTEDVELNIVLEPAEVDNTEAYAAYVPLVERAIEDTNDGLSFDATADNNLAQGYLADLDGDGIDEILMCYYYNRSPVYSLYDYENGEAVKVVEREKLIQAMAGGDLGTAAVVNFDGEPTVMIMDKIGDGGGVGVTHLYNYAFYDYPSMERKHLLGYWQEEGESGPAQEKFYINNEEVTKERLILEMTRCEELKFSQRGYDFYTGDPMSLRELLETVRGPVVVKGKVYETKFVDGVKTDLPIANAAIALWLDEEYQTSETIYTDETGSFEVDLTDSFGYDAEISAEGYISKSTSFSVYDEELEVSIMLVPDTYEAAAQAFMDKHGYQYMDTNQRNRSIGMLYDLNGDGQDELIMRAMSKKYINTYEVWTVVNGETKLLLQYTAQEISDWLYIAEYNGNRYFVVEEASPGSMAAGHDLYYYDVDGSPYEVDLQLSYWEMYDGSEGTYAIDGRDVTKDEFYAMYDQITTTFALFKEWENGYDGYPLWEFVYQMVA